MKKISIITINYNDAIGLKRTIDSVAMQTNRDFEFIIIDGGSNDGGVDVIKQNENIISYWCSEKDKGIYDAQNKGIAIATGEYLIFMNSGDSFYDSNVLNKFSEIQQENNRSIIYGDVNTINESSHKLIFQSEKLDSFFWFINTLNHQATFIKRNLFKEFGLYSKEYKISADFEFFLKVWLKKPEEFFYYSFTVCNFNLNGLSQQMENSSILFEERGNICVKLFPSKAYKILRKKSRKNLPFKSKLLEYIYERAFLNFLFQKLFRIFNKLKT